MTAVAEAERSVENVVPDPDFTREILKLGGKAAKKCFQCGTCSVVCNLSPAPDGRTFPRKEMIWTQWGLKERLLSDPAVWLCHQCSDCSDNCPRGGNPGDVLAAVRTYAIMHFAVPGFMARVFADPRFLPLIFGIPALLLFGLLTLAGKLPFPAGEIYYNGFIPDFYIEMVAYVVVGLVLVASGLGMLRFWKAVNGMDFAAKAADAPAADSAEGSPESGKGLGASFVAAAVEILKHTNFALCGAEGDRRLAHLGIFYGTPFLLAAAGIAAIYTWTGRDVAIPLDDPVKILGNTGAVLLFVGINIVLYNRLKREGGTWGHATYFDWFFIVMIYITALTGILMEVVRFGANWKDGAYSLYLVHLVIVFVLFVYAPYGKFAHVFYRTLAMTVAKRQEKAGPYKLAIQVAAILSLAVGVGMGLVGFGMAFALWSDSGTTIAAMMQGQSGTGILLAAVRGYLGL